MGQLCDAVATEHVIIRVLPHCVEKISEDVYDEAMNTANPVFKRTHAFVRELRRNLRASSDQRQYLLSLIGKFRKVKDPVLSEIADLMESEL